MNSSTSFFNIFDSFFFSPFLRDSFASKGGGRRSPRFSSPTSRRITRGCSAAGPKLEPLGAVFRRPERRSAGRCVADVTLTRSSLSQLGKPSTRYSKVRGSRAQLRVSESRIVLQSVDSHVDSHEVTRRDVRIVAHVPSEVSYDVFYSLFARPTFSHLP